MPWLQTGEAAALAAGIWECEAKDSASQYLSADNEKTMHYES
jgi:hypothetical protein